MAKSSCQYKFTVNVVLCISFNFFPNPKDGSIYALREGDQLEVHAVSKYLVLRLHRIESGLYA